MKKMKKIGIKFVPNSRRFRERLMIIMTQVSSAEHVGTLAENVMEALSQNKDVS